MDGFGDNIKKLLLAGIGVVATTAEKSKDCRTQKIQAAAEKQPALRKNSYSIRGHPPTRSILFLSVCLQTENRMNFRQHFVRRSISTHRKEFQYSKKPAVSSVSKNTAGICAFTLYAEQTAKEPLSDQPFTRFLEERNM